MSVPLVPGKIAVPDLLISTGGRCMKIAVCQIRRGSVGFFQKPEIRFVQGPVPFDKIAALTGDDHVFPGCFSSPRLGDNVVYGEMLCVLPAILTGKVVPLKHISFAEGKRPLIRSFDIFSQANNDRKPHRKRGGTDHQAVEFHIFRFSCQDENNSSLCITEMQRFVCTVEDKYLYEIHRYP